MLEDSALSLLICVFREHDLMLGFALGLGIVDRGTASGSLEALNTQRRMEHVDGSHENCTLPSLPVYASRSRRRMPANAYSMCTFTSAATTGLESAVAVIVTEHGPAPPSIA